MMIRNAARSASSKLLRSTKARNSLLQTTSATAGCDNGYLWFHSSSNICSRVEEHSDLTTPSSSTNTPFELNATTRFEEPLPALAYAYDYSDDDEDSDSRTSCDSSSTGASTSVIFTPTDDSSSVGTGTDFYVCKESMSSDSSMSSSSFGNAKNSAIPSRAHASSRSKLHSSSTRRVSGGGGSGGYSGGGGKGGNGKCKCPKCGNNVTFKHGDFEENTFYCATCSGWFIVKNEHASDSAASADSRYNNTFGRTIPPQQPIVMQHVSLFSCSICNFVSSLVCLA